MRKIILYLFLCSTKAFSHDLPHCESLTYSPFPMKYAREIKISLRDNVARVMIPSLQETYYFERTGIKSCLESLEPTQWKNFSLFSTNEVSAFILLEAQERIAGFSGLHWLSPSSDTSKMAELGVNPTLETLMASKIDALFSGPFQMMSDEQRLASLGIQSLSLMDMKEGHPLGRVEWLYYFGLILSRFEQAHELVEQIKSTVTELTQPANQAPQRFLIGHFYHGQWFTPGADHELVQLIKMAGGESVFADLKGRGPYSVSFEEVIRRYNQIDIWIPQASWSSLQEGLLLEGRHAFLNREGGPRVFLLIKERWSIPFFESGVLRPDLVMKDLKAMIAGQSPEHFFKATR
jgi:iron complex transport system substrate-binding protein